MVNCKLQDISYMSNIIKHLRLSLINFQPYVLLFCLLAFLPFSGITQDTLSLNSTFSTTENCGYKTKGIFVAWWDKDFDYAEEAEELLITLEDVQKDCLETYKMLNPPNTNAGYYYNIYIHNGHDLFPDGWAMGQGTDSNGYPFLTIPIGYANLNNAGLQHEGFHIFQYNANSPGFAYSGDSQWYIEATANWYAALKHPGSKEEFVTASCITYNPQVPMWYTFNNRENGDQGSWVRYCHQYGMNIMINYFTDVRGISPEIIVGGFFAETDELPQEYLFKHIGADQFQELFADYAAHNVGGFEYFPRGTEARTYRELATYGDLDDTHPIVQTFDNEGTDGEWIEAQNDWVTRAWAYNVYKIENSKAAHYEFYINGDSEGENGETAVFKGRVVVKNGEEISYYSLDMEDLVNGSFKYKARADDDEIYLVIVSTPYSFSGNHKFRYRVKIDYSESSGTTGLKEIDYLGFNYPNPCNNETNIPYGLSKKQSTHFIITDSGGREIFKSDEGYQPAGKHILKLKTEGFSSGIYYYTLKTGNFNKTRSFTIK